MNEKNNTERVFINLVWRFAERIGAQGVKLLVELILARLLLPDDYGLIALVTVLITILNVFVDSGLGNALIQKKDADHLDFSTVFWFNVAWCLLLYTALYAAAPFIARFFRRTELTAVLRVLGLQIIISGVKNVQQAFVSRNLQFKKFFFATLGGTIGAALVGVSLAYYGFGVWALVAQQLFNTTIDTAILWLIVKWHPRFEFSLARLRILFSYGWKLLASALIDTVYNEIRQVVIGRIYTSPELAFYNRGNQFPAFFISNINSAIDSVLLPTMSKEQDDRQRVKSMTRRAIQVSTYIIAPLTIGLAFVGEPFVRILLSEKWLPCVPYMRIFCITYLFYPTHTANLNAIKAMGRSDLFLKLEIIKKIVGILALIITMNISVMAMAYSLLVTSVLAQIINTWPNKELLDYGYIEQLKDILPEIIIAAIMGGGVYLIKYLELSDLLTICLQIPIGAFLYLLMSKGFNIEAYKYTTYVVKTLYNRAILS